MLTELTLQLTAFPERAWPRFVALSGPGTAIGPALGRARLELPSPLRHAVSAASASVVATGLGAMLRPGASVAGVVLAALAALVGYVGGTACAVELSSRWIVAPDATPHAISRFASGAVLPVALSGIPNVLPLVPLSLVLALAGAAASAHSGWVGASAMLALEGQPRKRAAAVPAGVAVGLVLLATLGRVVLPA
ncbi:MAG TPA: hypothetical protein VG963_29590 [Polyangiaceae bacterium]|nr:hypothetical protein [Polyangiaceae bacterium]